MSDSTTAAAGKGQQWVAQLFQLVEQHEQAPEGLDVDKFIELYGKVERSIELSGDSEAQAFHIDQALFNQVSLFDVDHSPLRMIVSHALAIHHRYHADYGRGFEQAYKWCEQSRPKKMPDLGFVKTYLVPALVEKGALGNQLDVCLFLLERLGRFENLEKDSPVWNDEQALELLRQEPSDIAYQLARRRVMYIAETLTRVPNSLEQRLHKDGAFRQLAKEHEERVPLLAHQIRAYDYLSKEPFFKRVGLAIAAAFRGLVERMAGEYIAYELTKRNGAFLVQSLVMVAIVLGLMLGLYGLNLWNEGRLQGIEKDLETVTQLVEQDAKSIQTVRENAAADLQDARGGW